MCHQNEELLQGWNSLLTRKQIIRIDFHHLVCFQKAREKTFIRRIEYVDYNKKDAWSEIRIVKGGCDDEYAVFQILSQMGKGINSTILFYGPMP